jgi:hypothetical protein
MARVTSLLLPEHGSSNRGPGTYMIQKTVDLTAQAISCGGGDIVECLTIPANTKIISAGMQVVLSATASAGTDATATLGTGADDNEYVAAFDIDGATDGAYAPAVTVLNDVVLTTSDTLDMTFAGTGTTFTAGKIRVFALLMDVSDVGDHAPTEVDRDTLA